MVCDNEAKARIKINILLKSAGWRFEVSTDGWANIFLEIGVKFKYLDEDLENVVTKDERKGSIGFLLLDKEKRPLVYLVETHRHRSSLFQKQARN